MKVTYCFRPGAGEDANTAGTGIAFFIWLVSILLRAFSPLLLTNNTLSHSAILSLVCDVVRLIFSPGARKWAESNCKRCKRWITKKTHKVGPRLPRCIIKFFLKLDAGSSSGMVIIWVDSRSRVVIESSDFSKWPPSIQKPSDSEPSRQTTTFFFRTHHQAAITMNIDEWSLQNKLRRRKTGNLSLYKKLKCDYMDHRTASLTPVGCFSFLYNDTLDFHSLCVVACFVCFVLYSHINI